MTPGFNIMAVGAKLGKVPTGNWQPNPAEFAGSATEWEF